MQFLNETNPMALAEELARLVANSVGAVTCSCALDVHGPVMGGLHCERLFGPLNDYECHCGKYRGDEHDGHRCERCGVEVISKEARSKRWAHIDLPEPVMLPQFADRTAEQVGISEEQLEKVIMCRAWLEERAGSVRVRESEDHRELVAHLDHTGAFGVSEYLRRSGLANSFLTQLPVSPPNTRVRTPTGKSQLQPTDHALEALIHIADSVRHINEHGALNSETIEVLRAYQRAWSDVLAAVIPTFPHRAFSVRCANPGDHTLDFEPSPVLHWTGANTLRLFARGAHVAFSRAGEVANAGPVSITAEAFFCGTGENQRFLMFDLWADRLDHHEVAVLDTEHGTWVDKAPFTLWCIAPGFPWQLRRSDGQAAPVRPLEGRHEEKRLSACGRFVRLGGGRVYSIGEDFGAHVATVAETVEHHAAPLVGVVGAASHLDEDGVFDVLEGLAPSNVGALARQSDGTFLMLENRAVATEHGRILAVVATPFEAAAFSPDGTELVLWCHHDLRLVNLKTLRTTRIDSRAVSAAVAAHQRTC